MFDRRRPKAMKTLAILGLAALLLCTAEARAGDIEGTVKLTSVRERAIGKKKIRPSKSYGAEAEKDAEVPKGENELQYTVIQVLGDKLPCTPKEEKLEQRNKTFIPHVLVIPVGSSVRFLNYDDFEHNVYSVSEPGAFDTGRYRGKMLKQPFKEVNAVEIFCGLHPRMNAYIVVTPNNFFARAQPSGHYKISGVPAGTYQVKFWHPRVAEAKTYTVKVPATGSVTQNADL